jgi:hypothetical protein
VPGFSVGISATETFPGSYSKNGDLIMGWRVITPSDLTPAPYGAALFNNVYAPVSGGTGSTIYSLSTSFVGSTNSNTVISGISNTATAYFGGPLVVGQQIIASGVQVGATIASIISSSSISITLGSTSSIAGATITVVSPLVTTSGYIGVCAREVKTVESYANLYGPLGTQNPANFGSYAPGTVADVVQRGSCVVQVTSQQAITPWGLVFYRIGVGGTFSTLPIGTWESVSDPVFNICLTNMRFTNASVSSDYVTEVCLLTRNTA